MKEIGVAAAMRNPIDFIPDLNIFFIMNCLGRNRVVHTCWWLLTSAFAPCYVFDPIKSMKGPHPVRLIKCPLLLATHNTKSLVSLGENNKHGGCMSCWHHVCRAVGIVIFGARCHFGRTMTLAAPSANPRPIMVTGPIAEHNAAHMHTKNKTINRFLICR